MLMKDQGKQAGREDDDIHFGLVGKACKLSEDMHMPCCVLDSMDCELKQLKVRSHMVAEVAVAVASMLRCRLGCLRLRRWK